jgi:hypothetical protein
MREIVGLVWWVRILCCVNPGTENHGLKIVSMICESICQAIEGLSKDPRSLVWNARTQTYNKENPRNVVILKTPEEW